MKCARDDVLGYDEHLIKQTQQNSGTSVFRMLSTKDFAINGFCNCAMNPHSDLNEVKSLIHLYNHFIFDFDRHQLTVEHLPDEKPSCSRYDSILFKCIRTLQRSVPRENPILYYRINIEKLAKETKGFNHASCQCGYPAVEIDQFLFLDYTYLSHVHLTAGQNTDHAFVLIMYGGIAAL
ncbi:unnamed protein product [Rotaria magnacalcarata]|uniref:Uncharacterized protein n=1 Tax=Rotaria magnacalcarata TaxID=392030 RepID=A0A819MSR9_9BILA|nr:unnamed protein product [Rotaria magnacalcarata]CAF2167621.1 unnamed protein product [Rotaria magnacalcarata]CAF3983327.1 unnamed protein product [Rotaria magnacalcarata]CAF3994614.1 unnamed protein product [Rotaria magnacalcarata]